MVGWPEEITLELTQTEINKGARNCEEPVCCDCPFALALKKVFPEMRNHVRVDHGDNDALVEIMGCFGGEGGPRIWSRYVPAARYIFGADAAGWLLHFEKEETVERASVIGKLATEDKELTAILEQIGRPK